MPEATARAYKWSDIPADTVAGAISRRYISTDRVTVAEFRLPAGVSVPAHAHLNEQVSCVLAGTLRVNVNGREFIVGAGEVLHIPASVEHQVDVLQDAVVVDVFSPARADW